MMIMVMMTNSYMSGGGGLSTNTLTIKLVTFMNIRLRVCFVWEQKLER